MEESNRNIEEERKQMIKELAEANGVPYKVMEKYQGLLKLQP